MGPASNFFPACPLLLGHFSLPTAPDPSDACPGQAAETTPSFLQTHGQLGPTCSHSLALVPLPHPLHTWPPPTGSGLQKRAMLRKALPFHLSV